MPYLFNDSFFLDMQRAFKSAIIQSDLFEQSDTDKRDYFLVKFIEKPIIDFDEEKTINILFNGDKKIAEYCNLRLMGLGKVELGLRWAGSVQEEGRKIIFSAFCVKIIYSDDKVRLQSRVIQILCDLLRSQRLINDAHDLHLQFPLPTLPKSRDHHSFFKFPRFPDLCPTLLPLVIDYIQTYISPIFPAYIRQNEFAMNPAYQDITATRDKLFFNEKKIWLFRSDMIVAVGNKNAYWINFTENGLADAIDSRLHRYINWEDRYGHPSLSTEYPGYHRGAFYGGLLAQRNGYLEMVTSSGRYFRNDLGEKDKQIVEAYLAYVFQKAYGRQPIVFIDSPSNKDYFECSFFYNDQSLPAYCLRRKYDTEDIEHIFEEVASHERSPTI